MTAPQLAGVATPPPPTAPSKTFLKNEDDEGGKFVGGTASPHAPLPGEASPGLVRVAPGSQPGEATAKKSAAQGRAAAVSRQRSHTPAKREGSGQAAAPTTKGSAASDAADKPTTPQKSPEVPAPAGDSAAGAATPPPPATSAKTFLKNEEGEGGKFVGGTASPHAPLLGGVSPGPVRVAPGPLPGAAATPTHVAGSSGAGR